MKPAVKPEFQIFYNENVKELAMECSRDFETLKRVEDTGIATDADKEIINQYGDTLAAWYIGLMVRDIERAFLDGQSLNMINSVGQIRGVLTKDSTYWGNVWKNDFSTKEAQQLKALGVLMDILITKL